MVTMAGDPDPRNELPAERPDTAELPEGPVADKPSVFERIYEP